MTTITDICNAALSHCGTRSRISSIDEGSTEANACRTHIAMVRDATLRVHDWNFARMTRSLALLSDPPARWSCKYALPPDCVRLLRLNDMPLPVALTTCFELAADIDAIGTAISVVLTDAVAVSAIYTARIVDPLRWDQGFADTVAYGLASRICYELSGKEDRARTLAQLWQATLNAAATATANEGSTFSRAYVPEALAARGYDIGLSPCGSAGLCNDQKIVDS